MIEDAREYLALGWAPIPVKTKDKRPLIKDWSRFSDNLPEKDLVDMWWSQWPVANIGLVTGRASGLLVLDIDSGNGGWESIKTKNVPDTLKAITGSDGGHIYFKFPSDAKYTNRAGLLPGVDVRGHGGQIIAPPSVHPNGKTYRWRNSLHTPLHDPPDWLLDLLIDTNRISIPKEKNGSEALSRATLEFLAQGAPEGQRNNRLFKAAADMAGCGLCLDDAEGRLVSVALRDGVLEEEARATIRSAFSKNRISSRTYYVPDPMPVQSELKGVEIFSLDLPESVWRGVIGDYRKMLATTTEASDAYHLFTFLACVGSVIGRQAYITYGNPIYCNLYVCLVGKTGQDRKSTALRHAERTLRCVDECWRVLRGLSSAEGLLAQIADPWQKENRKGEVVDQGGTGDKRLMVWLGELSSLLRKAKQERVSNIVPIMTEAFDCPPDLHLPTKADPITVTEPYISLVAASTPSWLEDLQDRDVLGGFANRFAFVLGEAKAPIPFPDAPDVQLRDQIVSHIKEVMEWLAEPVEITLTESARDLWREYYTRWHSLTWSDEIMSAMVQRVPDMVLKISLLFAVLEKRMQIDAETLTAGIDAGGYLAASMQRIFSDFHTSKEIKREKRIETVLADGPMKYAGLRRALGGRHSAEEINKTLYALKKSGQISEFTQGRGVVWGLAEHLNVDKVDKG